MDIELLSFEEWIAYQTKGITEAQLDNLAGKWLDAVVESFAQKRPYMAPIDEPCEEWLKDLVKFMKKY